MIYIPENQKLKNPWGDREGSGFLRGSGSPVPQKSEYRPTSPFSGCAVIKQVTVN